MIVQYQKLPPQEEENYVIEGITHSASCAMIRAREKAEREGHKLVMLGYCDCDAHWNEILRFRTAESMMAAQMSSFRSSMAEAVKARDAALVQVADLTNELKDVETELDAADDELVEVQREAKPVNGAAVVVDDDSDEFYQLVVDGDTYDKPAIRNLKALADKQAQELAILADEISKPLVTVTSTSVAMLLVKGADGIMEEYTAEEVEKLIRKHVKASKTIEAKMKELSEFAAKTDDRRRQDDATAIKFIELGAQIEELQKRLKAAEQKGKEMPTFQPANPLPTPEVVLSKAKEDIIDTMGGAISFGGQYSTKTGRIKGEHMVSSDNGIFDKL